MENLCQEFLSNEAFNYHLIGPDDLQNYTELSTSVLKQKQTVAFHGAFSLLLQCMENLAGEVEQLTLPGGKLALKVFQAITIIQEKRSVVVEWVANPVNDMYADAVLAVILQVESNPTTAQAARAKKPDISQFPERLMKLLRGTYGNDAVIRTTKGDQISVKLDGQTAVINLDTLDVDCTDESLHSHVSSAAKRLHNAMSPCHV
ncbi:Cleavage and polyadenylation specificity factor subunit 3 [Desmophyllum pertusum]|uniref:Cleavage and polyadenylation specificity factor subunit 3 n=1 Tax=Desmophyllum pertusum TaxID=174260 RepID=A0A9X0CQI4_9CNID|nr:Cleavage and polyadenylation specificity factor subunit 3 [Desmophyllum pertusum]